MEDTAVRRVVKTTAFAAGWVLVGIAIGFTLRLLWNETIADDGGNLAAPSTCATKDGAFLRADEYGDFVEVVDRLMTRSPYHGLGPDAPLVKPYVEGRLRGVVAAIAYGLPYKQENDAMKQRFHYEGEDLLLPLSGSIVRDTPGLLEAYQVNEVFASDDAAGLVLASARSSKESGVISTPQTIASLGDDRLAFAVSPPNPDEENSVGVVVRWGRVISIFSFKGGDGLLLDQVINYVQEGFSRLSAVCHDTDVGGDQ